MEGGTTLNSFRNIRNIKTLIAVALKTQPPLPRISAPLMMDE
jgi:hypothetical protein